MKQQSELQITSGNCCSTAIVPLHIKLNEMETSSLPVIVIGAGPIGLAAAAHLAKAGEKFIVLEAGTCVGNHILQWGTRSIVFAVAIQYRQSGSGATRKTWMGRSFTR